VPTHKFSDLLRHPHKLSKFEASGVCVRDGHYYVIFDNLRKIARIEQLVRDSPNNDLIDSNDLDPDNYKGYEGNPPVK